MAPDDAEARRLAELHLQSVGSPKSVDKFEGRARRDWQVELALRHMHGAEAVIGTFWRMTDWQMVQFVPDE